jgi:hypothetical protein
MDATVSRAPRVRGRTILTRTAKSCGPVAPTLAISCADDVSATMGARKPGSPGRSRISRNTVVQGRPACSAKPVVTAASFFVCWRAMGAACTRPSLRPQFSEGRDRRTTRTLQRRGNANVRAQELFDMLNRDAQWRVIFAVVPDKLAGRASARAASADPGPITTGACWREERCGDHLVQRLKPVVMGSPLSRGRQS